MKTVLTGTHIGLVSNVAASGVSYIDTGGLFGGGTLTLEQILAIIGSGTLSDAYLTVIGGGKGTVQALGTLGATELIDLANANKFWGTLDQACTISTTGWTNGKDCAISVELIEDGTGGWTPTFSGVTWIGGTPSWDTTAGTVTHVVLFSRDGGTTIYGAVVGGNAASDGMVPYLIPTGQTFTVPVNKQALKAMAITVNGTLVVNGFLIEVN